ncbi:MAG: hypothetical protein WD928_11055 [Gammaproteobacteria bacterium]
MSAYSLGDDRRVQETISIKGKPQAVIDTRCQNESGEWVPRST